MKKYTDLSLEKYLELLSSEEPVPGGGSVSVVIKGLPTSGDVILGPITIDGATTPGYLDTAPTILSEQMLELLAGEDHALTITITPTGTVTGGSISVYPQWDNVPVIWPE